MPAPIPAAALYRGYRFLPELMRKFGPVFAQQLRRRGRRPGDKPQLDEAALEDQRLEC